MDGATYNSLELRWFMRGAIPESFLGSFESNGAVIVRERRKDSYWPLSRVDMGIKRRNGGPVEMKVRRSARSWDMPSGSTVVSEQWNKWRPSRLPIERRQGLWLDVDKQLLTRTFGPSGHEVQGAADGRRPLCEVELANVTVASTTWWTVALEATGPATLQPSVLSAALDRLWSLGLERWLEGAVNAGYPEWLELATGLTVSH